MANHALPARTKSWGSLALVAMLAIVAGVFMPQLLPDEPPATEKHTKDIASPGSDLHYAPPEIPTVPSTRALFLRLGGMTALVLVIGVGVLCVGKFWLRGKTTSTAGVARLCLLESLELGGRCTLHLVQIASRQVLIGADATGIKSMVPLTDDFDNFLDKREQESLQQPDTASGRRLLA